MSVHPVDTGDSAMSDEEPMVGGPADPAAVLGGQQASVEATMRTVAFTGGVVLFALVIVLTARAFTFEARLLPLTFGIPMLLLSTAELVRGVLQLRRLREAGAVRTRDRLPLRQNPLLWFAALSVLILLLGLTVGGAIFFALMLRFHTRTSLVTALLVGAGSGLLYRLLIVELLAARTYGGVLNL